MNEFRPLQFGKYLILDKIATGGMAELYLSKIMGDQGFSKLVAIKKILPHLVNEQDLVKSFIDEAKLAAYLQHENIIQIYDFGSMQGNYFIAMEYLFGKDLRAITNKAKNIALPINLENALLVASKICAGLNYSHKLKDFLGKPLNIIHRDISPPNILITYDGQVKIIDFGIAKCENLNQTTQRGFLKGKLAYMSPEQAVGKPIDLRSDLFSAGILLYEMVTQKRMFEGETMEVFARVREAIFEPPESIVKNLPGKLYEIIYRALEKNPQYRYQSAEEMLTDIELCIQSLPVPPQRQGLADYMSKLFKEESLQEEYALRKYFQEEADEDAKAKTPATPATADTGTPPSAPALMDTLERTVLLGDEEAPISRKKHFFRYVGLPAGIFLIGIIVALVFILTRDPVLSKLNDGMKAFKTGDFPRAVTLFEETLAERPSVREMIRLPYAEALRTQAYNLKDRDPETTKAMLLKSLELDPEPTKVYLELGQIYVNKNELADAMNVLTKINEADAEFPEAQFLIGYTFEKQNNFSEAERIYDFVVDMAPPFVDEVFVRLATVQEKSGHVEKSMITLTQALNYNPENQAAKTLLKTLQKKPK